MQCPWCNQEGTIRAQQIASGKGRMAFCDNLNCYTWFNIPNACENADGIVEAREGMVVNKRVTLAQRECRPNADTFELYAKTCPIVEEVG